MSAFDKIIGYASEKNEIEKICDVVKNFEKYKKLGVKMPKGILLHGVPGVGKTLMANCFIQECGRVSFVCRKSLPDNDFLKHIEDTFEKAKRNSPSIVLLDDMDKYANTDDDHKNADAYVAIQSLIDSTEKSDVFIIATANSVSDFPDSLLRAGRFDLIVELKAPTGSDYERIIKHFLASKSSVADLDVRQLARILNGKSCAQLEIIINQAGIHAGFQNKSMIEFDDIIKACLRSIYDAPETIQNESDEVNETVVYHEAGHAAVAELVEPGSVTLVSIGSNDGLIGGFTSYYRGDEYWRSVELMQKRVLCLLGGKCAVEIKFGKIDAGCCTDIERAVGVIARIITQYAALGFDKCITRRFEFELSDRTKYYAEKTIADELSRYYLQVKELLAKNRAFLDKLAVELMKKRLLTASDIKRVKESV